ncbi:MAG: hypothetical protein J0H43_16120, partial [Actinobacteria bacterium]|nr:hypothetical protein [Actinomycetota bacterium]
EWVDDPGGWSYTTILASVITPVSVSPVNAESTAIRWWPIGAVSGLRLHQGFAAAWPTLQTMLT